MPFPKGKKRSEETRRKISLGMKGRVCSTETRAKISKANKGQFVSSVTRAKISKTLMGSKHTEEAKKKIGDAHRNKQVSDETKRRMSEAQKGTKSVNFGKKFSEETRKKMSEGQTKRILDGRRMCPSKFKTGHFYSEKNQKDLYYRSSLELAYFQVLEACNDIESFQCEPFSIPYLFEGHTKRYVPDLIVNFVDGARKLVEMKPLRRLKEPQIQAKHKAAKKYAIENSFDSFEVWTEDVLALWAA